MLINIVLFDYILKSNIVSSVDRSRLLLFFIFILFFNFRHFSHWYILLFNDIKRALEVLLLNPLLNLFNLVSERIVGLHNFEISKNFELEIDLFSIDQVAPQSLLIILKDEAFEVFFV